MSDQPTLVAVGTKAFIINHNNELLLLKKPAKPGKEAEWDIPGGGIHHGETPYEGVRREIIEESGLEVDTIQLLEVVSSIHPTRGYTMHIIFQARATSDQVIISDEHTEFAWVNLNQIDQYPLTERYATLLPKLLVQVN